jgi:HTH-type transcriptional regulator, competence development regulator
MNDDLSPGRAFGDVAPKSGDRERPPPGGAPATTVLAVNHGAMILSTMVTSINCRRSQLAASFGALLRQAREVRELSGSDAARAAGISAAYLSKLESDAVKKPSPQVLHRLSEVLAVPYTELMRLSGYPMPVAVAGHSDAARTIGAALFADLTDDERDELLEYLAWYRARRRSSRGTAGAS